MSLVDHIAAAAKELYVDRSVLDEIVELLDNKARSCCTGHRARARHTWLSGWPRPLEQVDALAQQVVLRGRDRDAPGDASPGGARR